MSHPIDGSSDAGVHHLEVFGDQQSPSDAQAAAGCTGDLEVPSHEPEGKDTGADLTADNPLVVRPVPDGPDEGAAEQVKRAAVWLTKLSGADNRAFTVDEQAEIRDEIKALHAKVEDLMDLTLQQREAIDQSLAEAQRSSEQMGRKDWVTYAIGAATSLVIMEMVPPLALLPLAVHAIHALGPLLVSP